MLSGRATASGVLQRKLPPWIWIEISLQTFPRNSGEGAQRRKASAWDVPSEARNGRRETASPPTLRRPAAAPKRGTKSPRERKGRPAKEITFRKQTWICSNSYPLNGNPPHDLRTKEGIAYILRSSQDGIAIIILSTTAYMPFASCAMILPASIDSNIC